MSLLVDLTDLVGEVLPGYTARRFFYDPAVTGLQYVVRPDGGPQPVPNLIGYPRFVVWLIGNEDQMIENYDKMQEVMQYIHDNYAYGDAACFRVKSDIRGPFQLEQNRHYYELNIDAIQNRGTA